MKLTKSQKSVYDRACIEPILVIRGGVFMGRWKKRSRQNNQDPSFAWPIGQKQRRPPTWFQSNPKREGGRMNIITLLEACKTVIERIGKKDPGAKYCLEQIDKYLREYKGK